MISMTSNLTNNTPRAVAVAVGILAIYLATLSGGIGAGTISAAMTTICISPLFTSIHDVGAGTVMDSAASHVFTENGIDELQVFRDEEHSMFGRIIHQTIELCNLDELVFVFCILRENRGLLILLVGGVTSMMMALLAGFEDTNIVWAFSLSIACYVVTTVLVARSARTIVDGNSIHSKEEILSVAELKDIMKYIPTESFIPDCGMQNCHDQHITRMLFNRSEDLARQSTYLNNSKQSLVDALYKKRNYNDDCCICLSAFEEGQTIRVLPRCHHEFHKCCIDKWALTFATKQLNPCRKRGKPKCPLCNLALVT